MPVTRSETGRNKSAEASSVTTGSHETTSSGTEITATTAPDTSATSESSTSKQTASTAKRQQTSAPKPIQKSSHIVQPPLQQLEAPQPPPPPRAPLPGNSKTDQEDLCSDDDDPEQNRRVDHWLSHNSTHVLAIQHGPHEGEETVAPAIALPPIEGTHDRLSNIEAPAGESIAHKDSDIVKLATAIKEAVQSGTTVHRNNTGELPYFNGAHQEWLSFKAAYSETRVNLSDGEMMNRLRRCLKGKAREAVESLLIHNTAPDQVMKTLQSRFGRPEALATAEIERLKAVHRPADTAKDLCIFASRIVNIVATLKAIKQVHYLYHPEATRMTIDKLPPTIKCRWYDYAADDEKDEPDLVKLSRFLEREADRCGRFAQPEFVSNSEPTTSRRNQRTFNTQQRTPHSPHNEEKRLPQRPRNQDIPKRAYSNRDENSKAENSSLKTQPQQQNRKCPVCEQGNHMIADCNKFKASQVPERWEIAKKFKLCYKCLRYRSQSHNCKHRKCELDGCTYAHHRLLHSKRKPEVVSSTWSPSPRSQSYLKIVPIQVIGPKRKVNTFALLDDGSTVTLIDEDLAQQAGLRGRKMPLLIEAIGKAEIQAGASRRVKMTIKGAGRRHAVFARTMEDLQLAPQTVSEKTIQDCKHLQGLDGLMYKNAKPRFLIGQDNWPLLMAKENKRGNRDQPVASLTPLGWVLHGAHSRALGQKVHYVHKMSEGKLENIDAELKHFFSLEALGIAAKRPQNDPEVRAQQLLNSNVNRLSDGRFEAGLLWKNDDIVMPNNREYAIRRLEATERKIEKDKDLKTRVHEEMRTMLEKGYAEEAPKTSNENRTWYLPCFPVVNSTKPGKVRMVHDAAATVKGVSLNSCLLTGPDLLQSLPGVLMRIRQFPIAVSADITEMFLQVKIREQDRDALRYLWRSDRNEPPIDYRMTSLIFGATSSPATAIYVKNRNAADFAQQHPRAAKAIDRYHYMDDYIQSFKTKEEAIEVAREVSTIHAKAHFHLRKWTSNSQTVLRELDSEAVQHNIELTDGTGLHRLLGLNWKTSQDVLGYDLNLSRLPSDALNRKPTKRQALKIVMSLFDPLGLIAPVTIVAKQILQEIWRRSRDWDEELEEDLVETWQQWIGHLNDLKKIEIPRCYPGYDDSNSAIDLHTFVDASETAYATALYWRIETPGGNIFTSLVAAKARVAPLKTTSVPRLELQAAVMGARMAETVTTEHEMTPHSRYFWTDSKTVLTWLRTGARQYKPFVAHRIAEIEETTKIEEWRWVPTKQNVADDATRDVPVNFNNEHRWFQGPDFLKLDASEWPIESQGESQKNLSCGEERIFTINSNRGKDKVRLTESIPDIERFSRWERLVRTMARVLLFIANTRRRNLLTNYSSQKSNRSHKKKEDPSWRKKSLNFKPKRRTEEGRRIEEQHRVIPAHLIAQAEDILIRASQEESFGQDIEDLRADRHVGSQSKLKALAVELKDGVICIKSRIDAASNLGEHTRSPLVLDGSHHLTRLYIEWAHRRHHHQGVEATVNFCRQRFHILKLRPTTRHIVRRCLPCQLRRASPPEPPTGNLPAGRLAHHQRAFTFVGLDYFGPLMVTVGRASHKRYVALFTCLTTRAVHLEVAASLTTDSAVMALRRFISRRGCPKEIWSDNGTNLHGAEKELRNAIDKSMEDAASRRKIVWRFIPPSAPFMGGAWERMVKSVKTALFTVTDGKSTTEEVLSTLLAEVEFTVNSRPLTHVSVDPEDPESLTPNHFLLLGPAYEPPMGQFCKEDTIGRTHWRASQYLADLFWARWLKEYLPSLQYRREPHGKGPELEIGQIVIIADSNLPRNTWPMGRVIEVYPGPDGVVRAADVKTAGGVMRRPTKKLVILPTEAALPDTGNASARPLQRTAGECSGQPEQPNSFVSCNIVS